MLIAFGVAMVESLPLLGSFIPGFLTMPPIGWLIATQALPAFETLSFILLGGVLGDYLGYLLGIHCKNHVKALAAHYGKTAWLDVGEGFVTRYGQSSIIIGRFIGPLRSSIPLFAGILNMKARDFLIAAIPSVILWAIVHLSPGILLAWFNWDIFGSNIILTSICSAVIGLSLLGYLFQLSVVETLCQVFHKTAQEYHYQIFQASCLLLATGACCIIATTQGLASLNTHILSFAYQLQSPIGLFSALFISNWAETLNLCLLSTIISGIFLYHKQYRSFLEFSIGFGMTFTAVTLGKLATHIPRPELAAQFLSFYSFPSGHTALIITVTILLKPYFKKYKLLTLFLTSCSVLTPMTRLYLGAHWLTDVVCSVFISLLCIHITPLIQPFLPKWENTSPESNEGIRSSLFWTIIIYFVAVPLLSVIFNQLDYKLYYYAIQS